MMYLKKRLAMQGADLLDRVYFGEPAKDAATSKIGVAGLAASQLSSKLFKSFARLNPLGTRQGSGLDLSAFRTYISEVLEGVRTIFEDSKGEMTEASVFKFVVDLRVVSARVLNQKSNAIDQAHMKQITVPQIRELMTSFREGVRDLPQLLSDIESTPYLFAFMAGSNLTDLAYLRTPANVRSLFVKLSKCSGKQVSALTVLALAVLDQQRVDQGCSELNDRDLKCLWSRFQSFILLEPDLDHIKQLASGLELEGG